MFFADIAFYKLAVSSCPELVCVRLTHQDEENGRYGRGISCLDHSMSAPAFSSTLPGRQGHSTNSGQWTVAEVMDAMSRPKHGIRDEPSLAEANPEAMC